MSDPCTDVVITVIIEYLKNIFGAQTVRQWSICTMSINPTSMSDKLDQEITLAYSYSNTRVNLTYWLYKRWLSIFCRMSTSISKLLTVTRDDKRINSSTLSRNKNSLSEFSFSVAFYFDSFIYGRSGGCWLDLPLYCDIGISIYLESLIGHFDWKIVIEFRYKACKNDLIIFPRLSISCIYQLINQCNHTNSVTNSNRALETCRQ